MSNTSCASPLARSFALAPRWRRSTADGTSRTIALITSWASLIQYHTDRSHGSVRTNSRSHQTIDPFACKPNGDPGDSRNVQSSGRYSPLDRRRQISPEEVVCVGEVFVIGCPLPLTDCNYSRMAPWDISVCPTCASRVLAAQYRHGPRRRGKCGRFLANAEDTGRVPQSNRVL